MVVLGKAVKLFQLEKKHLFKKVKTIEATEDPWDLLMPSSSGGLDSETEARWSRDLCWGPGHETVPPRPGSSRGEAGGDSRERMAQSFIVHVND